MTKKEKDITRQNRQKKQEEALKLLWAGVPLGQIATQLGFANWSRAKDACASALKRLVAERKLNEQAIESTCSVQKKEAERVLYLPTSKHTRARTRGDE